MNDNLTIIKFEKKICKILKGFFVNKELSKNFYNLSRPVGSIRPRLYNSPKYHFPFPFL